MRAKKKPEWRIKREEEIRTKVLIFAVLIPMEIIGIIGLVHGAMRVFGAEKEPEVSYYKVSATGYYDKYGYGYGADGRPLVEGLTVAGRVCDLGKSVLIWECNEDGTRGDLIEIGEFRDTGYGTPTGYGSSSLLKGKSIGTIENGTAIDLYFDTYEGCAEWGRRDVYIQIIDAVG